MYYLQAPNGAGGVHARGPDYSRVHFIPIKRGEGCTEVRWLVVIECTFEFGRILRHFPYPQIIPTCGQEIRISSSWIWHPHDFCGRIVMIKRRLGNKFPLLLIQCNDLNLVVVLLNETSDGQSKSLVLPHRPVNRKNIPWCIVFINFFVFGY